MDQQKDVNSPFVMRIPNASAASTCTEALAAMSAPKEVYHYLEQNINLSIITTLNKSIIKYYYYLEQNINLSIIKY